MDGHTAGGFYGGGWLRPRLTAVCQGVPSDHPCRCLCLGLVLQNTNRRPLRRTKKQSLQRLFRDVLVFIPATCCQHGSCGRGPSQRGGVDTSAADTPILEMEDRHLCSAVCGKEPLSLYVGRLYQTCLVSELNTRMSDIVPTPEKQKQTSHTTAMSS